MPQPTVLQICHGYTGPFLDVARQYSDALNRLGYQVDTVYLTGAADQNARARTGGERVFFLEQSSREISGLKWSSILSIRRIVSEGQYAFCVTHRFKPAFIACIATQLPVIAVFHAYGTFRRFSRRVLARVFHSRMLVLGVSDAIRDDIRSSFGQGQWPRVETFHNRIDLEKTRAALVSRSDARKVMGIDEQTLLIGNVGRLHPDKDQATLLKGFALARKRLPQDCKLIIIGSGKLAKDLKVLAGELGLPEKDVAWLDCLPDARRYFKAFDIFALSSDHEPFGMVLLEAMIAGVSIVATKAGGVPEILGEDHPWMFPVGDYEALSELLVQLAGMENSHLELRKEHAQKRLVNFFSYEAAESRLKELLPLIPGRGKSS